MDSEGEHVSRRSVRRGRVVDAEGRAVGGAAVVVLSGTAPTPDIGRRTTEQGIFQVALPEGRFRMQAVAPSGAKGTVDVKGGEGNEIVIRIEEISR